MLLDVTMPELDGPSTLDRISALKGRTIPTIFFTAHRDEDTLATLAKTDAIGVLGKPFDPLSLAHDVRELLAAEKGGQVCVG